MLRKIEIKIDGEEYRGLMLRDSELSDEEAVPLLLEERIAKCEEALRGMRENIRELLLERASVRAGTVLTMWEEGKIAPLPEPEAPEEADAATEKVERRGGHSKQYRGKLDRILPGKGVKKAPAKKKEEVEIDPLVAAVCEQCRVSGDGKCTFCVIKKALVMADRQETPGYISYNAKMAVCAGCKLKVCSHCRLAVYTSAKAAVDGGESIEDAAMTAEADFQAALAEVGVAERGE